MYFFKHKFEIRFYILLGVFFIAFCIQANSQVTIIIRGIVFSEEKVPVANASVYLKSLRDSSLIAFGITKADGAFNLKVNTKDSSSALLTVSHVSFKSQFKYFSIKDHDSIERIVNFYLYPSSTELKEITINTAVQKVIRKKDTIEFSVSAHLTPEVSKVEDLLKNMNGFNIDEKGKIIFNGKEVEKIFIEGDDLTGGNYQLLSRNLNASLISKVQVINNFNDNRLAGDFEQSGTVAINLKINDLAKNKISGSLTLGGSVEKRFIVENSTVLIKQKIKSLVIANYNNIAISPMADIQYYFKKDDVSTGNSLLQTESEGFVNSTQIPSPAIDKRYTKNNNDIGVGLMQSFSIGKAVKVKFLTGYSSISLKNANESILKTDILNNNWIIQTSEEAVMNQKNVFVQGGVKHDKLKKNTGSYDFIIGLPKTNNRYNNISAIAVQDTLKEFLWNNGFSLQFTGNETFLLKKKKLITVDFSFTNNQLQQEFNVKTKRYADFFNLDSGFNFNNQLTSSDVYRGDLKLKLTGRLSAKTGYNYGFYSEVRQNKINNSVFNKSLGFGDSIVYQPTFKSRYSSILYMLFGQINNKLSPKSLLSTAFSIGYTIQGNNFYNQIELRKGNPFKLSINYKYNISSIKVLSVNIKLGQSLQDSRLFFNGPVLNGGLTIKKGASDLLLTRFCEASFSYFHMNIYKNSQFFINSFLLRSNRSYTESYNAYPDYLVTSILPVNNNFQFFLTVGSDKYIPSIKSKFLLQLQIMQQAGNLNINNVESRTTFISYNSQIKYLSTFSGKFNFEMLFASTFLTNHIATVGLGSTTKKFWQYYASGKAKISLSKKVYSNLFYVRYRLSPGNHFDVFDYFLNFKVSAKASFSLILHNIFNTSSTYERTINSINTFENSFALVKRYFLFKTSINF